MRTYEHILAEYLATKEGDELIEKSHHIYRYKNEEKKDLSSLERSRVKVYLVTEDNWFIHIKGNNDIEKVCQIDDATSFYDDYGAVSLYKRCAELGIKCKLVKYNIKYQPVDEFSVV